MTGSRHLKGLAELSFVVVMEILLYRRYQQGDGTFHYFTHLFAGASLALVLMTLAARRWRRPVRLPLLAVLAGHLFAMAPDILYIESVAHARWMEEPSGIEGCPQVIRDVHSRRHQAPASPVSVSVSVSVSSRV